MKIRCTVCNKAFHYGDYNSPMFVNKIWNEIITHYKLADFEKEATRRFYSFIKKGDRSYRQDCHVFVCSECAEKALSRKITNDDINDSEFNIPFRKRYFKAQ